MKRIFNTLSEKWPEYLIELLVIIGGIIGAFMLNSWNDDRKDRRQEQLILTGLKTEFEQNLAELASDHYYNTLCLEASRVLLSQNGQATPAHVVDSLYGHVLNYATFDPRVGVVEEVISSGKLNLIQDEKLRYRLTQWSGELDDLEEDIIIRRDHYINQMQPIVHRYISTRNADKTQVRHDYPRELVIKSIPYQQANYDALMASSEFDGALYTYFISQTWVHVNEVAIRQFMEETLALIENNIVK